MRYRIKETEKTKKCCRFFRAQYWVWYWPWWNNISISDVPVRTASYRYCVYEDQEGLVRAHHEMMEERRNFVKPKETFHKIKLKK